MPFFFYLIQVFVVFSTSSVTLSDQERLTTLVRMEAAEMANSVSFMGHAYAMRGAASSLSPVGQIGEVTGGMSQVSHEYSNRQTIVQA